MKMNIRMKETAPRQKTYAPGHSEHELDRLSHQAEAFEPFTRQLFQQAGITPGMRVLDVGCGSGDVAFLAAELVGLSGEVIGADLATAAVNRATARAQARGIDKCKIRGRRSHKMNTELR
jgi:cyclopropane fatty-acyl-phospholipid synthase-like methyltransferase